ncbi:MAG TPA: YihY/virulence factor BrkB family protein [Candidatus Eisenbacteria bacterium]|jgi:membrane protein|nr:YihY/virulence factor BrkB family protein [Candidatus Eisenbacteria bacterium]
MNALLRNLRRTLRRFQDHEGPRIAASIAFYVLFSSIPALAFLITSVTWVIRDPHDQAHVMSHMLELLPTGSEQNRAALMQIVDAVRKASGGLNVLGAVGLAWSSLGMFSAARWGLNRAWGTKSRASFFGVRLMDLAAAVGIWMLLLLSALATAAVHLLSGEGAPLPATSWLPGLAGTAVQSSIPAALSFAAFLFVYRYVPSVEHRMKDVFPAALFAMGAFELTKHLFAFYVRLMTKSSPIFAALGGTLGFMLWVYLCAVILLLGAELGYVSSRYALSHEVLVDQPKGDDRRRQRHRESKQKV